LVGELLVGSWLGAQFMLAQSWRTG